MFFVFFSIIFSWYFSKRGVDVFFVFSCVFLVYFFPLIFFDKLVFFAPHAVYVDVVSESRFLAVFVICFVLLFGFLRGVRGFRFADYDFVNSSIFCFYKKFFIVITLFLAVYLFLKHGFGLSGRSKADLMGELGYPYKIYALSICFMTLISLMGNSKILVLYSLLLILFEILFGFRSGLAFFVLAYLIFFVNRSGRSFWFAGKVVLVFLFLLVAIIAKQSNYFSVNVIDVIDGIVYSSDFGEVFQSLMGESVSTSVVVNAIVDNDFSVGFSYLGYVVLALFPMAGFFDFEIVGFADYYKGVVLGSEGDSFASGMVSVGYALGGYFGVFFVLFGLLLIINSLLGLYSKSFYSLKLFSIVAVVFIVMASPRADMVSLVGTLKSLFFLSLAPWFLQKFLKSV